MKAFVFITGAVSASLTCLGILFKIMHWPGASIMLVLGMGILALVYIPVLTKYLYAKN